jgi:hypothetical protein
MPRRLRVRLLARPGSAWHTYGGGAIPEDRVIELSEADAARFPRDRGAARSVEIIGWVEDAKPESSSEPE